VKQDARSTLHPVVEGIVAVVEAVASDRREVLTVSTFDPAEQLFYSVPCTLGREGATERHVEILSGPATAAQLQKCLQELRKASARPAKP
jgi:malate/lactate dehydrogenase